MPRPGPRPYECVRRAWHSDRHPPIRGSLIQEIFRIANEVHSSTTRKNREWLEKLPTVVLKAEEIMYSKANSEAEYSDRKTLWDRLNDAIDTIIRRDMSTETGQLLLPCIEAALHLGCTPRRSSRSQRNESPRCYLKSQNAGPSSVPPSNSPSEVSGNRTNNTPAVLHSPRNLMLNQSIQNRKQNDLISPGLSKNFVPDINQSALAQTLSNSWPVYPLYYNSQIQPADIKLTNPSNSCSHLLDFDKVGSFGAPDFVSQSLQVSPDERQLSECDLTLRLGCVVVPRSSAENARPPVDENCNTRNFLEERNSRDHCTTNQIPSFPFGRFQ